MCTLTWSFRTDGYDLVFNRDELKSRLPAHPPKIFNDRHPGKRAGRYVAPVDADAGGYWLAVNQHGVTVCLLNNYSAQIAGGDKGDAYYTSRGEIVRALAHSISTVSAADSLTALPLERFRGFKVVVFADSVSADSRIASYVWDTHALQSLPAAQLSMPVSSSSISEPEILRRRADAFAALGPDPDIDQLVAFQSSHIDERPTEDPVSGSLQAAGSSAAGEPSIKAEGSVCMHRSYAHTVSQCLVTVQPARVSLRYTDGPPCRTQPLPAVSLDRICAQG